MKKLRVLDLFSGIGGFSLGLERTGGFETVAFCEINEFCRRILARHWPTVRQYHDVQTLTAARLAADGIGIDVICGGFPCQDISLSGTGAGLDGKRSGLWNEFARLIGELRPTYVLVENVAALLGRGLDRVLGDLASLGFDAEWHCIPASAIGAPHRRDRIWIVANSERERSSTRAAGEGSQGAIRDEDRDSQGEARRREIVKSRAARSNPHMADAYGQRLEEFINRQARELTPAFGAYGWASEPDVGRVAYGVPGRVDRLTALGNAVVPQIPEMIGRAILEAERAA